MADDDPTTFLDISGDVRRAMWAEHDRQDHALGFPTCGYPDGGTRPDAAPALCVLEPDHDGAHLIPNFLETAATEPAVARIEVGDHVEIHTRLTDSWSTGFEVAELVPGGYRVRRRSDGSLLPTHTSATDLRPSS